MTQPTTYSTYYNKKIMKKKYITRSLSERELFVPGGCIEDVTSDKVNNDKWSQHDPCMYFYLYKWINK